MPPNESSMWSLRAAAAARNTIPLLHGYLHAMPRTRVLPVQAMASTVCPQGRPFSAPRLGYHQPRTKPIIFFTIYAQYTGHEGYKKAEVTGGGIPLTEVDCRNLESRLLPGLFMCGEVMDVFGRIGGFNFLWAWISGRLAGLGAAGAVAGSAARLQPAAGKSETAGQGTKYVK